MRAEEACYNLYVALARQSARDAEHARLGLVFQTIPGFDLDGRHTFGQQTVEPRERLRDEIILVRRARGPDGGHDPAAGARNFLIRRAGKTQLELARALSGMDEVRMTIDQPRRDPAPVKRDAL